MKKSRGQRSEVRGRKKKPKRSSPVRTRVNPIPVRAGLALGVRRKQTKGAFGRSAATKVWKAVAISESQRQGDRISREKSLRREYAKFYATAEGREFTRKYGKSFQDDLRLPSEHEKRIAETNEHHALPEFVPNGMQNRSRPLIGRIDLEHPMHDLEPEALPSVELEYLSDFEIKASSAIFEALLRWCLNGRPITSTSTSTSMSTSALAETGERTLLIISKLRGDLTAGLELDAGATKEFNSAFRIPPSALENAGRVFGRVLEWIRRGSAIVTYGERLYLVAYALRPELIDAATLAKLGAMAGKTRQAKDKSANCLRDTISGIKALAMRGDITRIRCKNAQLEGKAA